MRRLAGLAAAAFALASTSEQNDLKTYPYHQQYGWEEGYKLSSPGQMIQSGDTRKAARNHHRRMKASGRHNWRASK